MKLTLAKNLFPNESKLPISLEQFFNLQLLEKLRLIVTGSCNSSRHQRFMRENFSKKKLVKRFPRNSIYWVELIYWKYECCKTIYVEING